MKCRICDGRGEVFRPGNTTPGTCPGCHGTGDVQSHAPIQTTGSQTSGNQTTPNQITPNPIGPNSVEEYETGPEGEEWLGWNGQKLARYTIFVWVDFKGDGTLLDLDGIKWLHEMYKGKFDIWKNWGYRDLYDNGFSKHQTPKEPGLYRMDATYWTTGGEDADFNHHVNKCSKVELRPTDHPDSICPLCGENKDLSCAGETDGEKHVETGFACAMCHAKGLLRASLLVVVLNEAYRAAEEFIEFLSVPMFRDEGPARLERLEEARTRVEEARTK